MRAMILESLAPITPGSLPLRLTDLPDPEPGPGQVLIRVRTCGVCHTELDEIEGRTAPPRLPVVLGHQVVGEVVGHGEGVTSPAIGARVGVGWIASACGECDHCLAGDDNLCPEFQATGCDIDGGYAELMTVSARYAHPLPDALDDVHTAPLLCAGAIGWRSLRLCNLADGQRLGLTGFGGSGHLVLQLARHLYPRSEVFVFARDPGARTFARELGADWAGGTEDEPPAPLDAVIDTTPAWLPVVKALERLAPGGRLVINAIRKEDGDKQALMDLDYARHLWQEREIKSVANVAGRDITEFLELAAAAKLRPEVEVYDLADANRALVELRSGGVRGAKVLRISS
ncbi:zinc-dependent alcohol dehydrogenase family protein [bacterium]|nr:zinc-dependent alcohol dehydrogenase family protein [bacterium]